MANGRSESRSVIAENPVADWVAQIKSIWIRDRSATIDLAKIIFAARRKLHYGQWAQMWKCGQLPFSKRKGEMLALIGRGVGSLDAQNSAHLPSAWNTLYYLARLDRTVLEKLILDGTIHPALTLHEAKALAAKSNAGSKPRKPNFRQRFKKFEAYLQANAENWPDADRNWARCELLRLADELSAETPGNNIAQPSLHTDGCPQCLPACEPTLEATASAGVNNYEEFDGPTGDKRDAALRSLTLL